MHSEKRIEEPWEVEAVRDWVVANFCPQNMRIHAIIANVFGQHVTFSRQDYTKTGPTYLFDKGFFTGCKNFTLPQDMGLIPNDKVDFQRRTKRGDHRSKLPENIKVKEVDTPLLKIDG